MPIELLNDDSAAGNLKDFEKYDFISLDSSKQFKRTCDYFLHKVRLLHIKDVDCIRYVNVCALSEDITPAAQEFLLYLQDMLDE